MFPQRRNCIEGDMQLNKLIPVIVYLLFLDYIKNIGKSVNKVIGGLYDGLSPFRFSVWYKVVF